MKCIRFLLCLFIIFTCDKTLIVFLFCFQKIFTLNIALIDYLLSYYKDTARGLICTLENETDNTVNRQYVSLLNLIDN